MVHTGVSKNLSNAIIENYKAAINGMTECNKFLSEVNLGTLIKPSFY